MQQTQVFHFSEPFSGAVQNIHMAKSFVSWTRKFSEVCHNSDNPV